MHALQLFLRNVGQLRAAGRVSSARTTMTATTIIATVESSSSPDLTRPTRDIVTSPQETLGESAKITSKTRRSASRRPWRTNASPT
jgi:hypothetical protein